MTVPAPILALIERFQEHSDDYRSSTYNETQLRREFLDPFFTALGWDMDNRAGAGQAMREVLHEYSIKIDGQSKAPDYCFRSGATEKFFVEAKKPAVNLKEDWKPAFQTRTYGWQQNLPFCVLTDFEEFAVYDCRFKPETRDTAQTARIFYCKYSDYPQQWPQIENWFGREAVLAGSLEQQAASSSKKGALPFDVDFLNLISSWRERLANNIAERNRALQLTQTDLNYAVQMTIDRILFLRMCEDRGLEPFEQLQTLRAGKNIYGELLDLFRQADNRYNSGLFHFGAEKARGGFADQLTPQLKIDDYVLADIIYKLYLPSPYNFRTMSVEILGQVYEQFLGKVIRLEGNKTSVEEKPEVRKAGGVYYTPSYIVNYIVAQTVGKLCAGKTPVQVARIKVLDPACGSGSFLIGAYNYLLQWHLEFYLGDDPEKHANKRQPTLYRVAIDADAENDAAATQWRLTASEKKRILLANIYGVDIDRQAVEVTKLSLLLKMLEDTDDVAPPTPQGRLIPSQQRLLPDLEANIKCGNSLIGHDFFTSDVDYSEAERERINAFDWDIEFAEIMQSGGFDAVIGNPPWGAAIDLSQRSYLSNHFPNVADYESSQYFLMLSMSLMHSNSSVGFIIPNTFALNIYAKNCRLTVLKHTSAESLCDLSDVNVFSGANVRSMLVILRKQKIETCQIMSFDSAHKVFQEAGLVSNKELQTAETWSELVIPRSPLKVVVERLSEICVLNEYCEVRQGYIPYRTTTLTRRHGEKKAREIVRDRSWHSTERLSSDYLPELQGADVGRYTLQWSGTWVRYGEWVSTYLPLTVFSGPRILVREIAGKSPNVLLACYSQETFIHNPSVLAILPKANSVSAMFVLGVLNSKPMSKFFLQVAPKAKKGLFPKIIITDAKRLPMPSINLSDKTEKAQHDTMVQLVERMLELQTRRAKARTAQDAASLDRQIVATDRQIDQLVYQLYDLSAEEIALVEAK